jgi:predicted  nucleic acid-binding Zn-ribbon protein
MRGGETGMRKQIEISEEELASLQELVKGIEEEVKDTKARLEKLEKSLEFLSLVLSNLLQDK